MIKKKIAILLPYKDNFTNSNAGSASIWVKDFNKKSVFKNQITIFGNTTFLKDLIDKKRYKNLYLNKKNFGSKNVLYVNEFIKHANLNKLDFLGLCFLRVYLCFIFWINSFCCDFNWFYVRPNMGICFTIFNMKFNDIESKMMKTLCGFPFSMSVSIA